MKRIAALCSMKRLAFRLLLISLPVLFLVFVDFILGSYQETASIKNSSRMFRGEAATMPLTTRTLLPNIDHRYHLGLRDDPHFKGGQNSPRLFRTQENGTIVNGTDSTKVSPKNSILFLGGSTTECNEVDEEYRFPTLVGHILSAETGDTYRGINLGVRANTSHDSTNLLLNHPIVDQVEIVVLMNNINDRLLLANRGSYNAPLSNMVSTDWGVVVASTKNLLGNLWDYYAYRSNILFLINTRILKTDPWTGEKYFDAAIVNEDAIDFQDPKIKSSAQEFHRSLIVFISAARSLGKLPVLMTQALGRESAHQKIFNDIVRLVATETKVHIIDLDKKIKGGTGGLFLSDDIHLNNEGSRTVGRIIAEDFKTKLLGLENTHKKLDDLQAAFNFSSCKSPPQLNTQFSSGVRRLLIPRSGRYPFLSHNEQYLLFQRWTGSREVIELFDKKTKLYKRLSPDNEKIEERHAVFWPDTENEWRILFSRKENGIETLFTRNSKTLKAQLILQSIELSGSIPAVGRDQIIYFAGSHIDSEGKFLGAPDLFRYDKKMMSPENLTKTRWEEWRPAPDPRGKYVYHIANPHGQFDIYRLDVDTGISSLFYGSEADEWDPDVSMDGRWVVFSSHKNGNWDLFLASTDDSREVLQLTFDANDDWDPKFTPSSGAIIFASSRDKKPPLMYYLCPFGETT